MVDCSADCWVHLMVENLVVNSVVRRVDYWVAQKAEM